tara:strand:+ start:239 stop:574 length:336 start_codon:yes stop_codon:yes gene_type:complete
MSNYKFKRIVPISILSTFIIIFIILIQFFIIIGGFEIKDSLIKDKIAWLYPYYMDFKDYFSQDSSVPLSNDLESEIINEGIINIDETDDESIRKTNINNLITNQNTNIPVG